jgi:hypothetical protein
LDDDNSEFRPAGQVLAVLPGNEAVGCSGSKLVSGEMVGEAVADVLVARGEVIGVP